MRISDWRSDVCSSDLKGKNIVSSPQARAFYDALPDQAKFPDMTAIWHEQQRAIAEGKSDTMTFVRGLADYVGREVARVKEQGLAIAIDAPPRSEEHTSELQSLMRISYAVFCLKKKKINNKY